MTAIITLKISDAALASNGETIDTAKQHLSNMERDFNADPHFAGCTLTIITTDE